MTTLSCCPTRDILNVPFLLIYSLKMHKVITVSTELQ
jgi:hypothetical protein